jgi:hypothetical protein
VRIPSNAHPMPDVGNLLATRRLKRALMFHPFVRPSTTRGPLRGGVSPGGRTLRVRATDRQKLRRRGTPICAGAFPIRSHATRQEHRYRYDRTALRLTPSNFWIKTTETIDGGHSEFKRHKPARFDLRLGDLTSASRISDRLGLTTKSSRSRGRVDLILLKWESVIRVGPW